MPGWSKIPAAPEDILARLVLAECEWWTRGGLEVLQARQRLLDAAVSAGCSVNDVASALSVSPADVRGWLSAEARGFSGA
jgi:hypothetical protein